jgi:hypothetical protein
LGHLAVQYAKVSLEVALIAERPTGGSDAGTIHLWNKHLWWFGWPGGPLADADPGAQQAMSLRVIAVDVGQDKLDFCKSLGAEFGVEALSKDAGEQVPRAETHTFVHCRRDLSGLPP